MPAARAARHLAAQGAAPERVAAQLLQSEPAADEWVVDALEQAAADVLARGAPETAVVYLQRALDEPPIAPRRASILHALGSAEAQLVRPQAVAHLRQAREAADDPRLCALATHDLGLFLSLGGSVPEAVELLEDAIAWLPALDRELALQFEAELAAVATLDSGCARRLRERVESVASDLAGDTVAERALLAQIALHRAMNGEPAEAVAALAERALATPRWLLGRYPETPQYFHALYVLVAADRYDSAARRLEEVVAAGRASGSLITLATASIHLARLAYRRGELDAAQADAEHANELVSSPAWSAWATVSLAGVIEVLTERDVAQAERALARYGGPEPLPDGKVSNKLLENRAFLRLAQSRPREALADFLELGRRERDLEAGNPALCPYRSGAALALVALGEHDEARAFAADELQLARRFGAPRAIGIALRVSGICASGETRLERLREAVVVLERSQARLEHARALVELGAALRRANRRADARGALDDGLALARRCGADALAQRAAEELAAIGVRRVAAGNDRDRLTPSERRVAQMASEGMSNPQIAQALFVSLKTVETHLGHAYRKLGIRSRAQLPQALAPER